MAKKNGLRKPRRRVRDDGWRLPDALWAKMEPLLPPRPRDPLGCHNPRVPDRAAMDAIFFVLRTGCHWNALRETRICSSSSAHRRFQEWVHAAIKASQCREGRFIEAHRHADPEQEPGERQQENLMCQAEQHESCCQNYIRDG